jgi:hypothetical protein
VPRRRRRLLVPESVFDRGLYFLHFSFFVLHLSVTFYIPFSMMQQHSRILDVDAFTLAFHGTNDHD